MKKLSPILASLLLATAICALCRGEQHEGEAAPLQYRTILAPSDRMSDWPTGKEKYLPLETKTFERMLAKLKTGNDASTLPLTQIDRAEYRARLDEGLVLIGKAELDIAFHDDSSVLLPLDPCLLSICNSHWGISPLTRGKEPEVRTNQKHSFPSKSTPEEPTLRKVLLGTTPQGKLGVIVEKGGTLQFDWSLAGRRNANGVLVVSGEIPAASTNLLFLDLPEDLVPQIDKGLILEPQSIANSHFKRWQIELGANSRFQLKISPCSSRNSSGDLPSLRETRNYDISPRGVDVTAIWTLQQRGDSLRQIGVLLDPGLELISATCDDVEATWTLESLPEQQGSRAIIKLPPGSETTRTLRLNGMAPLIKGCTWQLPRIRPEGATWDDGTLTVKMLRPLTLENLKPVECSQTATGHAVSPRIGESFQFHSFHVDATVEVELSLHRKLVTASVATSVEIGSGQITARVTGDFHAVESSPFAIEAILAPSWQIDEVTSIPAEAIADWNIEPQPGGDHKLTIRLTKSIGPERPLKMAVSAQRLRLPSEQAMKFVDIQPMQFLPPVESRRWVSLRAIGDNELKIQGNNPPQRLFLKDLPSTERDLFSGMTDELLFSEVAADVEVVVEKKRPEYAAAVQMEADAVANRLRESWEIRCEPGVTPVEKILVQLIGKSESPPQWKVAGAEGIAITATRRVSNAAEDASAALHTAEIWEIHLNRPQNSPFALHGAREFEFANERPLGLASLPEASRQSGMLFVRCSANTGIRIDNRHLKRLPPEPPSLESAPTVWATFTYDPARDALDMEEPPIFIAPENRPLASTYAWNMILESWHDPEGVSRYAAVWDLHLGDRRQASITLPEGVDPGKVHGVWLDDGPVAWQPLIEVNTTGGADSSKIAIALPTEKRFAKLSIEFATLDKPLRAVGRIVPRIPILDLPVLAANWQFWLPTGYESAGGQALGTPLFVPPQTLGKTLCGPLGRSADQGSFRIFSAEDWSQISGDPASRRARRNLDKFMSLLGQSLNRAETAKKNSPVSWSDILGSNLDWSASPRLLVDRQALDRLGVSGTTPLPSFESKELTKRIEELFERTQLALLASGDSILLTSQHSASLYSRQWYPTEFAVAGILSPGPLALCLNEALHGKNENRFFSASIWAQLPPQSESPWNRGSIPGKTPLVLSGWNAARQELSLQDPVAVRYVHRPAFQIAGLTIFLAVAASGCWLLLRRTMILLILAVAFAILALTLADPYAGLASWAMLGTVFGIVARAAFSKQISDAEPTVKMPKSESKSLLPDVLGSTVFQEEKWHGDKKEEPSDGTIGGTTAKLLLFAVAISFASRSNADDLPKKEAPVATASPVYRVFVPADAAKNPVGDKVFVPEEFYNELFRQSKLVSEKPQGWLLTSAVYRGVLSRKSTTGNITVESLKAQFDLHIFGRAVRVKIPFRLDNVDQLPESILLDGRPLIVQGQRENSTVSFSIDEPGDYRLELSLKPTIQNENGGSGFDLSIPRIAGARLELLLPTDLPLVEVPSAIGKVEGENVPSRIMAELGPTDRLTVNWREGQTVAAIAEIEKLLWLNVQPGSVVLDVRLKGNALAGRIRKLQLAADPRLRLQPLTGLDAPTVQVQTHPNRPQVITLEWAQPLPEQATVGLSFLWTGASGFGNLRLPLLDVLNFSAGKRILAISVDPQLEYSLPRPAADATAKTDIESLAAGDFLKAWGGIAAPTPAAAYRLAPNADWRLFVKPREPVVTAAPTLDLNFDGDRANVEYSVQLQVVSGYLFQYRLIGPKELVVRSLSLKKDGVEMVSRWTQDAAGAITVFLTGPADGRQELKLCGFVPLNGKPNIRLSAARIEQVACEPTLVRIYRHSGVLVDVIPPAGAMPPTAPNISSDLSANVAQGLDREIPAMSLVVPNSLESSTIRQETGSPVFGRLVRAYRVSDRSDSYGEVALKPNQPIFDAKQLVWLRQEDRQWRAGIECRIDVEEGIVDELQFDVSPSWLGPYTTSADAAISIVDIPGEGRRVILVPRQAISGVFQFNIQGTLQFEPGERPTLPNIALRHAGQLSRWVALPSTLQGQQTLWQVNGLKDMKLPEEFAGSIDPQLFDVCEATNDRPQAVLRQHGQNNASPQIILAEIQTAWQADGSLSGVAAFDLVPGGMSICPLQLPQGFELVAASIDGLPAERQPTTNGEWRLKLHSDRLPQRVAVVYRGTIAAAEKPGSHEFLAPALGDIPVAETLWTVAGPSCYVLGACAGKDPIDAMERAWLRFRRIDETIQQSARLFSEDNEETWRWYRLHLRYWMAARNTVLREWLPISKTESGRTLKKELETLEERQLQFAERLEMSDLMRQQLAAIPQASEAEQWWDGEIFQPETAVGFKQQGRWTSLKLDYARVENNRVFERCFAVFAILAFLALTIWAMRNNLWDRLLQFSPSAGYFLAALAGLVWWVALSPSCLGLVITVASVAAWVLFRRRVPRASLSG